MTPQTPEGWFWYLVRESARRKRLHSSLPDQMPRVPRAPSSGNDYHRALGYARGVPGGLLEVCADLAEGYEDAPGEEIPAETAIRPSDVAIAGSSQWKKKADELRTQAAKDIDLARVARRHGLQPKSLGQAIRKAVNVIATNMDLAKQAEQMERGEIERPKTWRFARTEADVARIEEDYVVGISVRTREDEATEALWLALMGEY